MKPSFKTSINLLLMILSVLGLFNVYSDNGEVETLAKSVTCSGCETILTQMQRSPLAQTFHFQVQQGNDAVVKCTRSLVFVGDYSCEKQ